MSQKTEYLLRDYQQELLQSIFAEWAKGHRRVMMQLPTGAGKTVLFSAVSGQFTQRSEGVLVVAHREELLLQAKEKLEAITKCSAGLIKYKYSYEPQHLVQVASVQSLVRRQRWPNASLLIIDEAHHSCAETYKKVLEYYKDAYILGVTATPARTDGRGFKFLYDCLISDYSIKKLTKDEYLCKFKLFAAKNAIKISGIKTTGGDYNKRELAEAVDASLVLGDLIETWQKYAASKKTIVFAVNVEQSQRIAKAYLNEGIPAEHLDGETPPEERRAILERFRTGQTLILCNCGIVSEGFDVPTVEAIQCVRPTKSLVLWLQMVGRGLRPAPNKQHCIIIDHTQNWVGHGLPDEEHEWSLDAVSLKKNRWTVACPECGHVFLPLPRELEALKAICPNCQTELKLKESKGRGLIAIASKLLEEAEAEISEIPQDDREPDPDFLEEIQSLLAVAKRRNYAKGWIVHKLLEGNPNLGLPELRACAKALNYHSGWAYHRWLELQQEKRH